MSFGNAKQVIDSTHHPLERWEDSQSVYFAYRQRLSNGVYEPLGFISDGKAEAIWAIMRQPFFRGKRP